ncbi:MAG: hypothetical protein HOV68_32565 [Streptomycetaceae bacterium]|nr:hypothetical protein [Streptomycetaceae bacterium]
MDISLRTGRRVRNSAAAAAVAAALLATAACGSSDSDDRKDDTRYTVTLRPARAASADELARSRDILLKRLEFAGVKGGEVRVEGDGIVVSAPTADRELLDGIEHTGRLDFRPVLAADQTPVGGTGSPSPSPSGPPPIPQPTDPGSPVSQTVTTVPTLTMTATAAPDGTLSQEAAAAYGTLDCTSEAAKTDAAAVTAAQPEAAAATCAERAESGAVERFLLAPSRLDGNDITTAEAALPPAGQGLSWQVTLTFKSAGRDKFADITGKLAANQAPENRFAITLDGRVIVAPTVQERLPGGNAVITGTFTAAEAKRLAAQLRSGTLPVAFVAQRGS